MTIGARTALLQESKEESRRHKPGLHVVDAGTVRAPVANRRWPTVRLAGWPHRVRVASEGHVRRQVVGHGSRLARQPVADKVNADLGLELAAAKAARFEHLTVERGESPARLHVARRRVQTREIAQHVEKNTVASFEIPQGLSKIRESVFCCH